MTMTTSNSISRRIAAALLGISMYFACVGCSSSKREIVVDLHGDAHCASWSCQEPSIGSDALDQTKLGIEGTTWVYGRARLMEKERDFDQMILLTFEKSGRLTGISVDQIRDADTKKTTLRTENLDARYSIKPGHIEFEGIDRWFKYVREGKVVLGMTMPQPSPRAPTRLSLQLLGGTKAAEFDSYVKGYNRDADDNLQQLLTAVATTRTP